MLSVSFYRLKQVAFNMEKISDGFFQLLWNGCLFFSRNLEVCVVFFFYLTECSLFHLRKPFVDANEHGVKIYWDQVVFIQHVLIIQEDQYIEQIYRRNYWISHNVYRSTHYRGEIKLQTRS